MSTTSTENTSFAKRCLASLEALFKQHKTSKYRPLPQGNQRKSSSASASEKPVAPQTLPNGTIFDKQRSNVSTCSAASASRPDHNRRSSQDTMSISSNADLSLDVSPTSTNTVRVTSGSTSSQSQAHTTAKDIAQRQSLLKQSESAQASTSKTQAQAQAQALYAPVMINPAAAPAVMPGSQAPLMPTFVPSVGRQPSPAKTTTATTATTATTTTSGAAAATTAAPVNSDAGSTATPKAAQLVRKPRPNLLPSGFELQPPTASALARRRRGNSFAPLLV